VTRTARISGALLIAALLCLLLAPSVAFAGEAKGDAPEAPAMLPAAQAGLADQTLPGAEAQGEQAGNVAADAHAGRSDELEGIKGGNAARSDQGRPQAVAQSQPREADQPCAAAGQTLEAQSEVSAQGASDAAPSATVSVITHIQNIGWGQGWQQATSTATEVGIASAGTSGRALRLEAMQIQVAGIPGSVSYQVHVQNLGWQAAQADGGTAGTSGKSLRLEGLRIALAGEISQWYDIEYRTHVQNVGWQDWVRNGAMAGTTGRGLRLEALDVRLVPKAQKSGASEGLLEVRGQAHVQNIGNQAWVRSDAILGTSGKSLRMESIRLELDRGIYSGGIEYRTHVQNVGWTGWSRDGQLSGTTGRGLRMEALDVHLYGDIASYFEVAYRAHVQNIGWQDWVSGGNIAGTTGRSLRVEALQIMLVRKPSVPNPERTVGDGIYALKVLSSPGNAVAIARASDAVGANAQLASNGGDRLEGKWQVTWRGNGYELVNLNSGLALDALGGNANLVANVGQYSRNDSLNQRWAIQRDGGGYTLAGMNFGAVLDVQDGNLSPGANLHLWTPNGSAAQRFELVAVQALAEGTYQLFTKLDQAGKCLDVPEGSVADNVRLMIGGTNDGPNQHITFARSGDGYTAQVVSSGKYLSVSGDSVVQVSRSNAATQVWKPAVSAAGGLVLVNAATGKVLSVEGDRNKSGALIAQSWRNDSAGQRWYPLGRALVSNGLYELRTAPKSNIVLDVSGASISSGANDMVHGRNGGNNQKFTFTAVDGSYFRIGMPLGGTVVTVQGSSRDNGANVRMEGWNGADSQLWMPVVTDGGLMFVNKGSNMALSFAEAKPGANVCQTAQANSPLQKWAVVKASLNAGDMISYRHVVEAVRSGGTRTGNGISGYSISQGNWNWLISAVNDCWDNGVDIGFVMIDCNTGMSVSAYPDSEYFGASTIKALWVTYLFQEYLERGWLSWGDIGGLAYDTIVWSDNDAYRALRASYGSEDGFATWLDEPGVRYLGLWDTYTPRQLIAAWTHMLEYSESGGSYVSTWKSLFDHSDHSAINEALGGYRNVYSKPGWMEWGTWSGPITNDAALVDDCNGRKYLLAIMSSADPESQRYLIRNVAQALDAIHMEMPYSR